MFTSTALHAGIVGLLVIQASPPALKVPLGVEIQYGPAPASDIIEKFTSPPLRQKTTTALPLDDRSQAVKQTPSPQAIGSPEGRAVTALERYKFELRTYLEEQKTYPETARRLSHSGTVVVHFVVAPDGHLKEVQLEQPSQSEILNRAALDLVRRAARFRPLPENLNELELSLPIEYVL